VQDVDKLTYMFIYLFIYIYFLEQQSDKDRLRKLLSIKEIMIPKTKKKSTHFKVLLQYFGEKQITNPTLHINILMLELDENIYQKCEESNLEKEK